MAHLNKYLPFLKDRHVMWAGIGFGCMLGWAFVPLYSIPPRGPISTACYWIKICCILMALALLLFHGLRRNLSDTQRTSFMFFSALLVAFGFLVRMLTDAIALGYGICGCGYAGMFLCWSQYFGTCGIRKAAFSIGAASLLAALLLGISRLLPQTGVVLMAAALPPLSAIAWNNLCPFPAKSPTPENAPKPLANLRPLAPKRILLAAAVYGAVFEFTLRYTSIDSVPNETAYYIVFLLYAVLSALLAIVVARREHSMNLVACYCAAFVFAAVSLLLLILVDDSNMFLPRLGMMLCYMTFGQLMMYMGIAISRKVNCIINVFAWIIIAEQAGGLVGSMLNVTQLPDDFVFLGIAGTTLVPLITVILLLTVTMFIISGRDKFEISLDEIIAHKVAAQESTGTTLQDRCTALAQTYGLTAREEEVLSLLAQGRSNPYIEQKLSISAGTVNSHVKTIYAKTGIHFKQDLLDLVYGA